MAWVYLLATLTWLIAMVRQTPCHQTPTNSSPDRLGWMCYTDVTSLYFRGDALAGHLPQANGGIPYIDVLWEYPVLTGYFATLANFLSSLLGADLRLGISGDQGLINASIYFSVTAVGLFICFLWLMSSMIRIAGDNPLVIYGVALSPLVMTTSLINWDLLVVALTAAGLASWLEGKPLWAGVFWGLGVAAKLYPLVIIGALMVLCFRRGAWTTRVTRSWLVMASVGVAVWLLVNLPMMVTHLEGWSYFYTFNLGHRGADLGSIWLGLKLVGLPVGDPGLWARVVMMIGYGGLALLIYFARRAPSAPQIAYLAVAVFVVPNLVYSPQYVLWMLPLLLVVRPRLRDLVIFTLGELFYFCTIWWYLRKNDLTLGLGDVPWVYVFAIVTRIGITVWLMVVVVRDVVSVKVNHLPSNKTPATRN